MAKQPFYPSIDEDRYINTTHRLNLTGGEISTILYYLDQVAEDVGDAYTNAADVPYRFE